MATAKLSRADVVAYFTGSRHKRLDPDLQAIEAIELFKCFKQHVPETRKRELVALIDRICSQPSYANASDVARHFGCRWFLSRIGFTVQLMELVKAGVLIHPVNSVYGLSPQFLLELGLLDRFLGNESISAEAFWDSVRAQIRVVAAMQLGSA